MLTCRKALYHTLRTNLREPSFVCNYGVSFVPGLVVTDEFRPIVCNLLFSSYLPFQSRMIPLYLLVMCEIF